jgi:hypothetical protein
VIVFSVLFQVFSQPVIYVIGPALFKSATTDSKSKEFPALSVKLKSKIVVPLVSIKT